MTFHPTPAQSQSIGISSKPPCGPEPPVPQRATRAVAYGRRAARAAPLCVLCDLCGESCGKLLRLVARVGSPPTHRHPSRIPSPAPLADPESSTLRSQTEGRSRTAKSAKKTALARLGLARIGKVVRPLGFSRLDNRRRKAFNRKRYRQRFRDQSSLADSEQSISFIS